MHRLPKGVLPVAGQVLANSLLIVPQKTMQCEHIPITDERQTVIHRIAWRRVGCNIQEEPAQMEKHNILNCKVGNHTGSEELINLADTPLN